MTMPERIWADTDLGCDDQGRWWDIDPGGDAEGYVRADLYDKLKDALHELTASRDTWTPVSQDAIDRHQKDMAEQYGVGQGRLAVIDDPAKGESDG